VNNSKKKGEIAFSTYPHTRLFEFAELAINTVSDSRCGAIIDGIVRVDIFRNSNGSLVVNELESLEAAIYGGYAGTNLESKVISTMTTFFETELAKYIEL